MTVPEAIGVISRISLCPNGVDRGSKTNPFDGCHESFPFPMRSKPWNIFFPRGIVIGFMAFVEHLTPNTTRDWAIEKEMVVSLHLVVAKKTFGVSGGNV